jgi:hypothetical protein
MSEISVECSPVDSDRGEGGWVACVTVTDHGSSRDFEVGVSAAELDHYAPGAPDPSHLVRRSFEFLLAREPKESILPSFGLSTIVRYFPEFEHAMAGARIGAKPGR